MKDKETKHGRKKISKLERIYEAYLQKQEITLQQRFDKFQNMILKSIGALGKKNSKVGVHEPEIDVKDIEMDINDLEELEFYATIPKVENNIYKLMVELDNEIVAANFNKHAVLSIPIPSINIFLVMSAIDTLVSWPKYLVILRNDEAFNGDSCGTTVKRQQTTFNSGCNCREMD
ncbi:hypothetical protein PanWU01x14_164780 [Parasponia andersonii]|uniref:Uncharacterized protein n=1 Tax=Parasponia andersonii TaxID=3476 RepID=A0A2P5CCG8_PARAD|nr:hypothetical protein PanWU01x14_164780 [Parasponia andersonii]